MNDVETLRNFLKEQLEAKQLSQTALSQEIGISQTSISRFVNGKTDIDAEAAFKIMRFLNLEMRPKAMIRRMGEHSPAVPVINGNDLITVDVVAVAANGDFLIEPQQSIAIMREFYRVDLMVYRIEGGSMAPTIQDHSYVGVVPVDEKIVDGGIYLVWRPPFGVVAKRVFFGSDNSIILRSDNPQVADVEIDLEGYKRLIIGKVVWVMQTLD